ncbi:MAG: Ig-like domain-containing protein [Oscillospiraceae bacterium]|nr:Ig-like domain-containing protein [Oscillospiraceae bacterium]
MENKVICYYCGTIYDESRGKCPLCGSSVTSDGEESRPVQRRRITDEERRERQRAAKGKYSAPKKKKTKKLDPKPFRIAALVFLILAVLVVFYFIGDMIGWWPGLEDRIVREDIYRTDANADACKTLTLDRDRLEFTAPGESAVLTASVNLDCGKTMYCVSSNEKVASVSNDAKSEIGTELKSAAFTVTATGYGEAELEITCGDQTLTCTVRCVDPEGNIVPTDVSEPDNYEPQLNYPIDASLYARGATLMLRVMNLPSGMKVNWTSDDVTVAKVNQNGIVTAISGGKTIVTAQVGDQIAQVLIRCTFGDHADDGAHLKLTDVTLSLARTETFNLFLYDADGERITDLTYTIEKPNVCEIKDGVVTPKNYGTTNVTVTYNGKEYICIVRVS